MSHPSNRPSVEIIVGICSARSTRDRREAVRETWLSDPQEGIECLFFVGGGEALPGEPDTVALSCPDGYEELPEKVLSFFRHCLNRYEFEWLFKCDDDTYLVQSRLQDLLAFGVDLVGNDYLDLRGSPSGGAGYLLSRRMVELLAKEPGLPSTGPEDIIFGEAAIRLGASFRSSNRLWSSNDKFPTRDNNMITSHWCSPGRLRTIHANLLETPRIVAVKHSAWADKLSLYPGGYFSRHETRCSGRWHAADGGLILLEWFEWGKEILIPEPDLSENEPTQDHFRCVPGLSVPKPLPPERGGNTEVFTPDFFALDVSLIAPYTASHSALAERFSASFKDHSIQMELIQLPTVGNGDGGFQSESWKAAVKLKQKIVLERIRLHFGKILVCADVDIQFFRPIRPTIEHVMKDSGLDMAFQTEGSGPERGYNVGFIVMRCNEKVLNLYETMCASDLSSPLPDQDWINCHLGDFPIKHAALPPVIWAWSHGRDTLVPEIVLHHANCTCGRDSLNQKLLQLDLVRDVMSVHAIAETAWRR